MFINYRTCELFSYDCSSDKKILTSECVIICNAMQKCNPSTCPHIKSSLFLSPIFRHLIQHVTMRISETSDSVQSRELRTMCYIPLLHIPQTRLIHTTHCIQQHSYPETPLMGSCTLRCVSRSMKSLSVTLK